jgi:hypothetical protein
VTARTLPVPPSFLAGTRLVLARELQAWFDGAIAYVALSTSNPSIQVSPGKSSMTSRL